MTRIRILVSSVQNRVMQVHPAFRDVVQDALYGRSDDALHLLCEDAAAEALAVWRVRRPASPRVRYQPSSDNRCLYLTKSS